jgi:hypothetical protein
MKDPFYQHDYDTPCGKDHPSGAECKNCREVLANLAALKASPTPDEKAGPRKGPGRHCVTRKRHAGRSGPRDE